MRKYFVEPRGHKRKY